MAFVGALLALLAVPQLAAQEAPVDEAPATPALASGVGTLDADGVAVPLPWISTAQGVLVALQPVADALGARLEMGPLAESYNLTLGDQTYIVAPRSPAATLGTEILPLSQAPQAVDGTLFVPVDLVERTWGERLGVKVGWDAAAHRLTAHRPTSRDLPVGLSIVHLQGVTTMVFSFPGPPRFRIDDRGDGWDVVPLGDRFVAPAPHPVDDPFVREVTIAPDRIHIVVPSGISGDHYRLAGPDRIVFDLYRTETSAAVPPDSSSPTSPPPSSIPLPSAPPASGAHGIETVVIDPGHGGSETGAVGPSGAMEKELTLLIARALAARLHDELGLKVALTRTDDVDLGLDQRSAFANQNKADLFLSIHLNSTIHGDAHGAETYFLSATASDQHAADAAALENAIGQQPAAPGSDEADLQLMLWDLAQSRHLAESQRLATIIQDELNKQLDLRDRGVKQAPFRVLMGAAMPAVLVELGFVSSPDDEQKLRDPAYRAQLVDALVRAIRRFEAGEGSTPTGIAGARP